MRRDVPKKTAEIFRTSPFAPCMINGVRQREARPDYNTASDGHGAPSYWAASFCMTFSQDMLEVKTFICSGLSWKLTVYFRSHPLPYVTLAACREANAAGDRGWPRDCRHNRSRHRLPAADDHDPTRVSVEPILEAGKNSVGTRPRRGGERRRPGEFISGRPPPAYFHPPWYAPSFLPSRLYSNLSA